MAITYCTSLLGSMLLKAYEANSFGCVFPIVPEYALRLSITEIMFSDLLRDLVENVLSTGVNKLCV